MYASLWSAMFPFSGIEAYDNGKTLESYGKNLGGKLAWSVSKWTALGYWSTFLWSGWLLPQFLSSSGRGFLSFFPLDTNLGLTPVFC